MWCLVSQPNINKNASLVIEVRLSHKATGQECLNQVNASHSFNFSLFKNNIFPLNSEGLPETGYCRDGLFWSSIQNIER